MKTKPSAIKSLLAAALAASCLASYAAAPKFPVFVICFRVKERGINTWGQPNVVASLIK
jgi:hypothetical protein